jgi:ribosomal-protein-alanine acetyltransferase
LDRLAELDRIAFGVEAWPGDLLAAELAGPGRLYLVAEVDGRVAGYAGLCRGGGEAEVMTLAVDPAARRRGLGRALMAALVEAARQAGQAAVGLTVAQDAAPALALYRSLGFEAVGRLPGYYQASGRDGRRMRLRLDQPG